MYVTPGTADSESTGVSIQVVRAITRPGGRRVSAGEWHRHGGTCGRSARLALAVIIDIIESSSTCP